MNVLSLFDGMSCGRLALERSGVEIESYYASEVDKYAIKVAQEKYPDTVQLGDVLEYDTWDLPRIDVLIGGSPCQDLSRIKSKDGKGLRGEKSSLFFTYFNALNKFKPKYFLLENVEMSKEDENIISGLLGVQPVMINSSLFSAQDRKRLYWTNIPIAHLPASNDIVIRDIKEDESVIDAKYYYDDSYDMVGEDKRVVANLHRRYPNGKMKFTESLARVYNINMKAPTLTAVAGGHQEKKIWVDGKIRKLTPLEYERLQNVPDGYTSSVSNSQRYKMLGNGWTVDVIAHIFKGLK